MKIDGEEYEVRELEWKGEDNDTDWFAREDVTGTKFSIDKVANERFPGQGEFYYLIEITDNDDCTDESIVFSLPEAKAFCQEHLKGEVMKLVEKI